MIRGILWSIIGGAALVVSIKCGKGGTTGTSLVGTCDTRTQGSPVGMCRKWTGQNTGDFNSLCTSQGGAYSTSADCTSAGLVGTCATDQGFGLFLTFYYYSTT